MQRVFAIALLVNGWVAACTPAGPNLASESAAIRVRDQEWVAAAGSGDLERTLSYWTEDAIVYPPNAPAAVGKAAIRQMVSESMKIPGFRISWKTDSIVVSASGDLAYAMGTNAFTVNDSTGKPATTLGRGVTVWRKEPDGLWRCVTEVWNSDASVPAR